MKSLYFISGTMGVGKTTISKLLNDKLKNSVFLDGDTCWNYKKETITELDKKEVIKNITTKLNDYLLNSQYENIIFCWVMQEQKIIDDILSKLDLAKCNLINVSLICDEKTLINRLSGDIAQGKREEDVIKRSIDRLSKYNDLDTIKIDTSNKNEEDIVFEIILLSRYNF